MAVDSTHRPDGLWDQVGSPYSTQVIHMDDNQRDRLCVEVVYSESSRDRTYPIPERIMERGARGGQRPYSALRKLPWKPAKRVLVVDDNRDLAESLAILLRLWGYDVHVAHDGRTALDVAREYPPDVAFVDIGLPQLNGYEVA